MITIVDEVANVIKTKYNVIKNVNNLTTRGVYVGLLGGQAQLPSKHVLKMLYDVGIVLKTSDDKYLEMIKDVFLLVKNNQDNFSLYIDSMEFNKDDEYVEIIITFMEML